MHHRAGEARSRLMARWDALTAEVQQMRSDLGGLTYEMAIRDHFRLDVLVRRAAVLQERDAELAEVERLLLSSAGELAGSCESCGAIRSRGAAFCWQCGVRQMETADGSAIGNGALQQRASER